MNVIITGCNRGIGLAILKKYVSMRWNVWACMRREDVSFMEELSSLAHDNGVWIKPVCFDLCDDAQIKAGMKTILTSDEPVHALVNNAGISHFELLQRVPITHARELFNVNFFAPFQIMQYVLRKMQRQGFGSVVNMSSTSSLYANRGDALYGASKAALNILTRDAAAEYGNANIRINAIAPGPTQTDMMRKYDKLGDAVFQNTPMKRLAKPEEIANAVFFLTSEEASFINGEIITVDGGRC